MSDELFVLGLAIVSSMLLRWAFQTLPGEKWQIMASIPLVKEGQNNWKGLNLTYYGFFAASATVTSIIIVVVLLAAIRVPLGAALTVVGLVLALCFPAAKVVAQLVEKKQHTFTIAGASFLGIVAAPFAVRLAHFVCGPSEGPEAIVPALAAISIAYGLGEGLGRLACISFGCCYGKPLSQCGPLIRRAFNRYSFVFSGKTKKIAYEGELDGANVVPIQAVTSAIYIAVSLAGILLYLKSHYSAALILVMVVTQGWRALSETLRADYRGGGRITAYQIMAMLAICYVFLVVLVTGPEPLPIPDLKAGLVSLWDPAVLILVQVIGLASFLYTGRSMVTESSMSFHVVRDRI